ncbi:MAG: hypothetical protein MZW92_70560 [Comamonadaceae bacterium]|nr:hypothetical protein [Comamonadaceae bacterium]
MRPRRRRGVARLHERRIRQRARAALRARGSVDAQGRPVRARALAAETNYVFHYPYASTPCFLLRPPKVAASAVNLKREDGASYAWTGGVGAERSIVAFSAICAAQARLPDARRLVHPLPEGQVGDLGRLGDPLLRRPQRLRPHRGRPRRLRARRRSRSPRSCSSTTRLPTSSSRSARSGRSSSTRSSASTSSSSAWSTAARRRRRSATAPS